MTSKSAEKNQMAEIFNRRWVRNSRLVTAVIVAIATLFLQQGASSEAPNDEPGVVFGAKIIDIALTLAEPAKQSLAASPETDVPAQLSFTDASGAAKTYDVTIRIKGRYGSRRSIDAKPAFKIKLRKENRFFGLEQLTLNNMVQDRTMLHEAVGYQVYEALGVKVPATGYARVSVNGEPYGLYLNVETIDRQFLKRQFGDDRGILYEGAYGVDLRASDIDRFQLDEGKDADRAQLKALIRALEAPGDDVFYGTPPQVDTRSFLAMMAAGTLLDDWDNYYHANNYRIYWNPSARRWVFIPTGIDQTFGSNAIHVIVFGGTGLLFQKCFSSERCTQEYAAAVGDAADRFEGLGLPARMDALLAVIDAASQDDPKKTYDAARMTRARDAMRAFIAKRPTEVRAALSCLDGGRELALGACAGIVAVNPAVNQCLEVVDEEAARNAGGISVAPCLGSRNQRWRLVATGDAFQLASVGVGTCLDVKGARHDEGAPLAPSKCTGTDSQIFSLKPIGHGTQLVVRHSGKCVAVPPVAQKGAALVQVTCAPGAAQTWRVQRSIYQ
jgi:CotH protein/ricin-type beta-trefoil lectin protein